MKQIFILFCFAMLFIGCNSDDDAFYTNELMVLDQSCSVDGFHPDYCLIMQVENGFREEKRVYFVIHYKLYGEWRQATTDTYTVQNGIKNIKLTINAPNEQFCEKAYALMYVVE